MKVDKELIRDLARRLLREDGGMEMVEWAVVGVVFAVAAAASWSALGANVDSSLETVGDVLHKGKGKGTCCD